MASSAVDWWIDLPLFFEFRPHLKLVGSGRGMPGHVEDLRGWTQEILRSAMAVQAPLHTQGLSLIDHAHLVDRTVTTVATHPTVHVDGMVEVGIVW